MERMFNLIMKKLFISLLAAALVLSLCGCSSSHNENDYDSTPSTSQSSSHETTTESSSSNDYDYDKGYGYTSPKEGQSFSDYVKEQDPELYKSITDDYNDAVSGNN